jgi:hypothetical protein
MKAVTSSETLVNIYQITRSHISEDRSRLVVNEELSSSDNVSVLYSEGTRMNLGRKTEIISPFLRCCDILRLLRDRFLPHPFQFIIH